MPTYSFPHPEKPESTLRVDEYTPEAAKRVYRKWYREEPGEPVEVDEKDWSETT